MNGKNFFIKIFYTVKNFLDSLWTAKFFIKIYKNFYKTRKKFPAIIKNIFKINFKNIFTQQQKIFHEQKNFLWLQVSR